MTADPIASIPYPILTGGADITAIMKPPIDAIGVRLGASSALPHGKYTCSTGAAVSATTWVRLPIDTSVDLSSPAPAFTLSSGARTVTVAQAGVYIVSAVASLGAATFALRILSGTTALTQTATGTSTSFSQGASITARFAAGAALSMEVYSSGATTNYVDSAANPCAMTVTRLGT